jgi:serine/threonine protein kinase
MTSTTRSAEDWQRWIQRMVDRLPAKGRYQRFYAELDRSIPDWGETISGPAFCAQMSVQDTEDGGVCMLDRLHTLWSDPAYSAPTFAALLRLCTEVLSPTAKANWPRGMIWPQARSAPRLAPLLLGHYELLRTLGRGGNGEVYLVWSWETKTLYALKLIRRELATDLSVRRSFRREAETWIRMGDHPNITKAYFYEEIADSLMVTMAFVEGNGEVGPSLADKIAAGLLDEAQVARWFVQVADGLAHAYAHGLKAHCDIKPGNILITRDGDAQVSDFGLAVQVEAMPDSDVGIVGTPHFMSPERFTRPNECDVRSDIYSLGITLYQALSGGVLPFVPLCSKNSPHHSMPEFLEELRSLHAHARPRELDTALWPVIARSLAKDPAARFADVAQFRDALVQIATRFGYVVPKPPTVVLDFWTSRDQGNTLMRLRHYEEAIRAFDAFLTHFPDGGAALNRACCLKNLGRYAEALQIFRQHAEHDDLSGLVNGSNCLIKLGDTAGALEYATRATKLFQSDPSGWIALGNAYFALSSWRDAVDAYVRAHRLDPLDPTPLYNVSLAGLRTKDTNLATEALQGFLALASPDDARRSSAQRNLQTLKGPR